MLKLRIIPVLSFNGFALVKTKQFSSTRMVGNPIQAARVYNSRGVDELALIDIHATTQNRSLPLDIVKEVLKECYMPVAVGGGIQSIEQISELLKIGTDKVIIKSAAINNPKFIEQAVNTFGSQCITIAVDVENIDGSYLIKNNYIPNYSVDEFIKSMNEVKVGEFLVTSTEKDGMMNGFNVDLAKYVREKTEAPIIFSGGAGRPEHYLELFNSVKIDAATGASIFHFTQYTPQDIKELLDKNNFPVRFQSKWTQKSI